MIDFNKIKITKFIKGAARLTYDIYRTMSKHDRPMCNKKILGDIVALQHFNNLTKQQLFRTILSHSAYQQACDMNNLLDQHEW